MTSFISFTIDQPEIRKKKKREDDAFNGTSKINGDNYEQQAEEIWKING